MFVSIFGVLMTIVLASETQRKKKHLALAQSRKVRLEALELELNNVQSDVIELQAVMRTRDRQLAALQQDNDQKKQQLVKSLAEIERKEQVINELHEKMWHVKKNNSSSNKRS